MATAGALVGASIAGLAYKLSGQNYTITFALATVPATMALLLTISVSKAASRDITSCSPISRSPVRYEPWQQCPPCWQCCRLHRPHAKHATLLAFNDCR